MRDTGVMNTGTPPRTADGARLGTALTRRAAINAATQAYLRGEAVDMSALAAQLGIGRSTLYRLVGNRDDLLGGRAGRGHRAHVPPCGRWRHTRRRR